jgi:hypothetical protein
MGSTCHLTMHGAAAAYQVGGMRGVINQFNIHSQQTVGLSNICAMIRQPNKTSAFKYPAHSALYYTGLRHVKRGELTTKYWRESSIYSGRLISTQEVSNLLIFSSSSSVQSQWVDINSGEDNCSYKVSVQLLHTDCQPGSHCS